MRHSQTHSGTVLAHSTSSSSSLHACCVLLFIPQDIKSRPLKSRSLVGGGRNVKAVITVHSLSAVPPAERAVTTRYALPPTVCNARGKSDQRMWVCGAACELPQHPAALHDWSRLLIVWLNLPPMRLPLTQSISASRIGLGGRRNRGPGKE
jgi:hypothetical protein